MPSRDLDNLRSGLCRRTVGGLFMGLGLLTLGTWTQTPAHAQNACPAVTAANLQGLTFQVPNQFELEEFERKGNCTLSFSANPESQANNDRIIGNPSLYPLDQRIPSEPLVEVPYRELGSYGGTLEGISRATESGTSDLLSVRHVNLLRYSDDLQQVIPNVAKSYQWNADNTELTFTLRRGHRWSDGTPFTADDVSFWYNDLILNPDVYAKTPDRWLFNGKPIQVNVLDPLRVRFIFPTPQPNIVVRFAADYGQPFQPKHVLSPFMSKYNPDAEDLARSYGWENAAQAIDYYYGGSDWKDVPSPLLKDDGEKARLVGPVVLPTLESHILVEESSNGRHLLANPYFHMVDPTGKQLPYINAINEIYLGDKEIQNLRILSGQISWKAQNLFLEDFPLLKSNEARGNFIVSLAPGIGETVFYAFNKNHKDPILAQIFSNKDFNRALSLAINRDEINEIVYLGQGTPQQAFPFDPATVSFIDPELLTRDTQYDPQTAKTLIQQAGLVDTDGNGFVNRPDGPDLVIRMQYSTQGSPQKLHELTRDYWSDIGVRIDLKEVSSDEYRATANNNDHDVAVWKNDGTGAAVASQDSTPLIPPFGDYFNPIVGYGWAEWKNDPSKGIEPPEDVKRLWPLTDQFLQHTFGSPESSRYGAQIVQIHADQWLKIGMVGRIVAPYMHHNSLRNVPPLTVKAYDYYWAYTFRPQQWYLRR